MAVSATHAALRLAQGAGRLIRRGDDRGVVAVLDSRMVDRPLRRASCSASLPPFWPTTDRALVLAALKRLDEAAAAPLPVHEPALRGLVGGADGRGCGRRRARTRRRPPPVAGPPPVPPSPRTAVTQGHAWTGTRTTSSGRASTSGSSLEELADHLELPADAVQARLSDCCGSRSSAGAEDVLRLSAPPRRRPVRRRCRRCRGGGRLARVTTRAPATGVAAVRADHRTGGRARRARAGVHPRRPARRRPRPRGDPARAGSYEPRRARRCTPARRCSAATRRSSSHDLDEASDELQDDLLGLPRAPRPTTSPSSSPTRAACAARRSSTR